MNAIDKKGDCLYKELTYRIRGALFEVYNILGPGFKEIVYQRALAKEFKLQGILYEEKKKISVIYKGEKVAVYEPDFIVDGKIIIEIKAEPQLNKINLVQLYYYLKGTEYKVGLIVNFGGIELKIKRRIFDTARTNL